MASAGAQHQQRRRSTALSSKCGQCHVDSRRRRLNTDLFYNGRSDHITDALVSLHRLRVPERIQFKMAVLT